MEFRILGPMEVLDVAGRPVALPRGRGRALLALLVLRAGEVVSTDRLIDELWGQAPPPTATKALHGLVSGLRKRLEHGRSGGGPYSVLATSPPGYVLTIDPGQVDAHRFRHLVEGSAVGPTSRRAAQLRDALRLWRGPALAEFTYAPFAQTAIAALDGLRLTSIEERIDADLALGRHAEVTGELERLVAENPLRERLSSHLMLALYRCGRQAEALKVYGDLRALLIDELGIEPGPGAKDLERAILRQDTCLAPRPVQEPTSTPSDSTRAGSADEVRPWLTSGRKTVTVMFVDLAGIARGRADPEAMQRILVCGHACATRAIDRHGGRVEGFLGDLVVGVFGVPIAHEDDALRAVRAAVELRDDLAALNARLESDGEVRLTVRIGVNTGEVLVSAPEAGRAAISGDAITGAARLQQAAVDDELLVADVTRRMIRDCALVEPIVRPFLAGGADNAGAAWRLVELVRGGPRLPARLDTIMVGRAAELRRLRTAFERAVREHRAERITVIAEAGVGKSRLALEFGEGLPADALVLTGACPSYGDGITFWPLREIVEQATGRSLIDRRTDLLVSGDGASNLAELATAIDRADEPGRSHELFPAVRAFFESLAGGSPLVVILEDVHWAQPSFLDLIDYLVGSARGAMLLLCLARTELLEQRRDWAQARDNSASLFLRPLGPGDTEQLVAERLAGGFLAPETVARIVATAQGNPLFVEQLLAAVHGEQSPDIPHSVQALLAARLDRLGPAERDLLRCASVLGAEFSVEALTALLPDEARRFTGSHLQALEDRELIRPSRRGLAGDATFGFRHVLIQVAAYRSITRQARSELHERVAQWLGSQAGAGFPEREEVIGYHLEQAYLHRKDVGLVDEAAQQLAERAGERLATAGLRAAARFDGAAAENLLSRARTLLPLQHPQRWEVRRQLAEALQVMGKHDAADTILEDLLKEMGTAEDQVEHSIRLERARIRLVTGPDPTTLDAIRGEAERASAVFHAAGDEHGLAQACFVLGLVHQRVGEPRQMEEVARRGLAHALRSGHAREELGARWWVALSLVTGVTPVRECIRSCEELVRWRGTEHPGVLAELARLRAMLGEFDEARELIARARLLLVERTRARRPLGLVTRWSAEVEIMGGDLQAGEREFRACLALALEMGEPDQVSQIAASLSRVLSKSGNSAGADGFASLGMDSAPSESVAAQALWRVATAQVLVTRAEHRQAERLAREAVRLVPPDMLNLCADVGIDLGGILLATGRREEALAVIGEAGAHRDRKGIRPVPLRASQVEHVRRLRAGEVPDVDALGSADPGPR